MSKARKQERFVMLLAAGIGMVLIISMITAGLPSHSRADSDKIRNPNPFAQNIVYPPGAPNLYGNEYVSGPHPDGYKDAIVVMDSANVPWGPAYFILQKIPKSKAGSVTNTPHKHPYAEVYGWFSTKYPVNQGEPWTLGGTVCFYMGEELEGHCFNRPTWVYVPANVPHGVVVYGSDISRDLMYVETVPGELVETWPHPSVPGSPQLDPWPMWLNTGRQGKVENLPQLKVKVPDFKKTFPVAETPNPSAPYYGGNYGKYFVTNGVVGMSATGSQAGLRPGNIAGEKLNFQIMYIWETPPCSSGLEPIPGKPGEFYPACDLPQDFLPARSWPAVVSPVDPTGWVNLANSRSDFPTHDIHAHTYSENMIWFGTNPDKPHELLENACVYNCPGWNEQQCVEYCFDRPYAWSQAAFGMIHTPLLRRNMTAPGGFIGYSIYTPLNTALGGTIPAVYKFHDAPIFVGDPDNDIMCRIPAWDRPINFPNCGPSCIAPANPPLPGQPGYPPRNGPHYLQRLTQPSNSAANTVSCGACHGKYIHPVPDKTKEPWCPPTTGFGSLPPCTPGVPGCTPGQPAQ